MWNRVDGVLMKIVFAKVTHKHFFVVVLGILSTFSFGSWAWPYSLTQNQNCSGNCESLELSAAFTPNEKLDARNVSSTPAEHISGAQSMDLSRASDIRTITPGNTALPTDQGAATTQANKNPATEGASTPGPSFFLLLGLVLIGIRLVISYRSRKLKNLATETH
jgi:hypothetical protein